MVPVGDGNSGAVEHGTHFLQEDTIHPFGKPIGFRRVGGSSLMLNAALLEEWSELAKVLCTAISAQPRDIAAKGV